MNITQTTSGTGFFYKSKNKLVFITAKHIIVGCDESYKKRKDPIDTLYVSGDGLKSELVDIRKFINSIPCIEFMKNPDVIKLNIGNNNVRTVNLFNDSISNPIDSVFILGFPILDKKVQRSVIILNNKDNEIFNGMNVKGQLDTMNYWISCKWLTKANASGLRGFSGAPVFVRTRKTGIWSLMGILVGTYGNDAGSYLLVCKMKTIFEELKIL